MPKTRIAVAVLVLLAALTAAAFAGPGEPVLQVDAGFGRHGLVSHPNLVPGFEEVAAIAVAPGSTIYAAGESPAEPGTVVIGHFWRDGEPEISFGNRGFATLPGLGPVNALTTDNAGHLIVLSQRTTITRLTAGGQPNPSFGSDGSVQMADLGLESLHLWSLAFLPSGSIAAAGITFGGPQMTVVQLRGDGSLDHSFNGSGTAAVGFGAGTNSGAFQLELQPDGKLLLGGYAANRPALARLLVDGSVDRGFGRSGRVIAPRSLHGRITALTVRRNGSILAGASGSTRRGAGSRALLLRYSGAGRLDRGFGAIAAPARRDGGQAIPIAVLRARRHIFMATRGRGPVIRAYRLSGQPLSLGHVPGVPVDRRFHVDAAPQLRDLVLAWTPRHAPGEGVVDLRRFLLR
jgi:uncharacterized delta-60 repeat protein